MKRYILPLSAGVLMLVTLTRPAVAAMLLDLSTLRLVRASLRSEPAAAYKGDLLSAIDLAQGSNKWTASYQASLAEGRGQFWVGDWTAAETALQAALGRESTPLLAKVFLAFVYARTNRPAEARDQWVQLHGADYFRLRQDYPNAAAIYERELAAGDFDLGDYMGLAEVYQALGRWQAARDTYEQALTHYPVTVQTYELLAQIDFWKLDDLDGAVAATQAAIALTPPADRYDQYLNLGHMYRLKGQPAAAEVWYHAAISLDDTRKDAHIGLAYILIGSGRIDQAANELVLALRADPADPVAQALMAKIHGR